MVVEKSTVKVRSNPVLKRTQILNEALCIIGERGYNGFSIQELAKRCRLTNAGLLHYFGSKEKLLIALLEDRVRRDTEAVIAMVGPEKSFERHSEASLDVVLKTFLAIAQHTSAQPELIRLYVVLSTEAMNKEHPAWEYFVAEEAYALKAFTRMVTPHVAHPQSTARQLLAALTGLQIQWLRANQGFDLVAEWKSVLAGLLPVE